MGLSIEDAYELLELPVGADPDSVRTSYKRLAQKWHPEKHGHTIEATKKFKGVSKAFKRLAGEVSDETSVAAMTLDEMIKLFKDVCFTRSLFSDQLNGSDDDFSSDDDDDDSEEEYRYQNIYPDKLKLKQSIKKSKLGSYGKLTEEQINKNAEELITEEEKEKRKAEKRKAKKKRKRDKKKLEKDETVEVQNNHQKKDTDTKDKKKKDKKYESSSSDETEFDPNSAFFTKVVNKKKKGQIQIPESSKHDRRKPTSDDENDELNPVVLRSRQLAIKGNEMAQQGHYQAAVGLFTEAVKLDPNDYRFFGNRSYCYDRTEQYSRALKDAEKAISLSKDWAKGYFRKGRALAGLRKYPDAEEAFTQVLKLDKNCEDAVTELLRVRTHQITDMGFSRQQAEASIKHHGTVQAAIDSLLASVAENSLLVNHGEVYLSDDDDEDNHGFTAANYRNNTQKNSQQKMDPRNPEGLTALWVGNVLPDKVDDKKLLRIFSKFGSVTSVRCLPEKFCAFVNFKTKEAAGKAMTQLQGAECGGQKLLIKFPDNPINNTAGSLTLRKPNTSKPQQPPVTLVGSKSTTTKLQEPPVDILTENDVMSEEQSKQSGPVHGDECYFFRTTGCIYGDKCRNKHVTGHQGLDRKPWQK